MPSRNSIENKQELINAIAAQIGMGAAATIEAVNQILATVFQQVVDGNTVQLIGLGSFSTGARAARSGRNPKTGEPLEIPAVKTVKFTAGKSFKDSINM